MSDSERYVISDEPVYLIREEAEEWAEASGGSVYRVMPDRPDRPAVVKPGREEIARTLIEHRLVGLRCACGFIEPLSVNDTESDRARMMWHLADALALLPGRSEREVLAQGWDEGAYEGWRLYSESFETVKERNPYRTDDRQEADRNG